MGANELLRNAPEIVKRDHACAFAAVNRYGLSLEHVSDSFKSDRELVIAAVKQNGRALKFASDNLKADEGVVLAAVRQYGLSLQHAANNFKSDKDVVMAAVEQDGTSLKYADNDLKNDKDVVFAAFGQMGHTIENQMSLKDVVLTAVRKDGNALQFASDELRKDKEVVKAAVLQRGTSLKFAKGGLNQDADMLKASGLWDDQENKVYPRKEQVTLSVKFSLEEKTTSYATEFALEMRDDPFLSQFKTYFPNAWCKKSCDPKYTNINHACRGTLQTCEINESENLTADRTPSSTSCWRFAFRFHQEKSKATGGFMIQVEEKEGLGDGQKIETEMADQVELKIFRVIEKEVDYFDHQRFHRVVDAVKAWCDNGCNDQNLQVINMG